jgi:Lambda phage tail tape-measure protein (Tape_meas_lam_C)
MTTVAKLNADLTADTASFEQGMKRAQSSLQSLGSVAGGVFKGELFKSAFDKAVESLKELTVGQAESIIKTSQQAQAVGASITEFEALTEVAKEAGVGQDQLAQMMEHSAVSIERAASGSKQQENALKALGLTVQSLIHLSPDQQFEKIATALSKIQNPTERTAIAMTLFGRSGADVNKMLADFGQNLDEVRAFQEKFNIAVSKVDAEKIVQAGTAVDKVKEAFGGAGNTLAVYFSPLVKAAANDLLNAGIDGKNFSNTINAAMKFAGSAIDNVRMTALGLKAEFMEIEIAADNFYASWADKSQTMAGFMEQIPGIGKAYAAVAGTNEELSQTAQSARQDAAATTLELQKLNTSAMTFKTTMEKVQEIQHQATIEAQNAVKHQKTNAGAGGQLTSINAVTAALQRQKALLNSIGVTDGQYKQDLADLKLLYDAHVISLTQYGEALDKVNLKMLESDKTMEGGFMRGMISVRDSMTDVSKLAEKTFVDGFTNAEDVIVKFAQTGKFSLSDFFSSLEADLIRLAVRQEITGPLANFLFGAPGGNGTTGGGLLGGILGSINLPSFDVGTPYVPNDMVAKIHKGERIIPAHLNDGNFGGGSSMNVTVINASSGAQVSTKQTSGPNGPGLQIMVDDMMSKVLSDPRSKTRKTLQATHGISPLLTPR